MDFTETSVSALKKDLLYGDWCATQRSQKSIDDDDDVDNDIDDGDDDDDDDDYE